MLDRTGRLLSLVADSVAILSGLAVIVMVLHITTDVFLRYVFGMPLSGTILFVSLLYMPVIVFFPLALAEKQGSHINVEILYDFLPKPVQRVLDGLSHALSVIVFSALAIRTWWEAFGKYSIGAAEMESGMRIITWPSYFVLPIGFAIFVAILGYRIACLLARKRPPFDDEGAHDPVEEAHGV